MAEPGAAPDPLEVGERGGRVERLRRGAEEVGHVSCGDGGGQALVGGALVPAARGDDAAELRDDAWGGCGGGSAGGAGDGREAGHGAVGFRVLRWRRRRRRRRGVGLWGV